MRTPDSLVAAHAALGDRQTTIDLWREYVGWILCRRTMTAIGEALRRDDLGIAPEEAVVAMENALMLALLRSATMRPFDLLTGLDDTALAEGFACIGVTGEAAAEAGRRVRKTLDAAREGAAAHWQSTPYPAIEVTRDGTLRVDDFSLPWSRPVARAFEAVLTRRAPATALECLLRAALRYDAIFARTRHIGPPQAVYDAFYTWGVRNEGFASPFNARLLGKPGARFFSAFPDTDAPFASHGSFFDCNPSDYDGHWCLDPPFLTQTMQRVDEIIARMREAPGAPSILLVVPMSHTPANPPDETVVLRKDVHVVEGLGDSFFTLPVDVGIHRYGPLAGFDPSVIEAGYARP